MRRGDEAEIETAGVMIEGGGVTNIDGLDGIESEVSAWCFVVGERRGDLSGPAGCAVGLGGSG
jgi:hypothetical protein